MLSYSLIFGISTHLQSTGWNIWKAFQMAKLGGGGVDVVANRRRLEGNYCEGILIPGLYLWRRTDVV